jgi:hypothetical protein
MMIPAESPVTFTAWTRLSQSGPPQVSNVLPGQI